MNKKYQSQIIISVALIIVFGALFLTGTFFDETIAGTLFSPGNMPVGIITSLGVYPFFSAFVLFSGALFERALHCGKGRILKIILCLVCVAMAVGTGFLGGKLLTDKSGLGNVFPSLIGNMPITIAISVVFEYSMFFVGFYFAKKTDDKLLAARIIGLLVILAVAFGTMMLLKNIMPRPRYRTVVLGYEGVGYVPWYSPLSGAKELAEMYGLTNDEFRSFPSGHSILSVSAVYIFPSLSWLFPKLKDKQLVLVVIGILFGCTIMFTRMILGAHYLSDVSMGATIASVLSLGFAITQRCISGKQK